MFPQTTCTLCIAWCSSSAPSPSPSTAQSALTCTSSYLEPQRFTNDCRAVRSSLIEEGKLWACDVTQEKRQISIGCFRIFFFFTFLSMKKLSKKKREDLGFFVGFRWFPSVERRRNFFSALSRRNLESSSMQLGNISQNLKCMYSLTQFFHFREFILKIDAKT